MQLGSFVLFIKIALTSQGILWFHTNFRILCSSSVKSVMGVLIRITLNLWIIFDNMDILIILTCQIHECKISFHLFVPSSVSLISVLWLSKYRYLPPWLNLFLGILFYFILL